MTRRQILLSLLSTTLVLGSLALLAGPATPARARTPEARLSEPARWLREYLRIDTTNPPGNEGHAAAFLANILHREGIDTRLLVSPKGRVSLYARLAASVPADGSAKKPGAVVLLHHLDVVPPGEGWTVDPFAGLIRNGTLYGRGALDIKSLGIAQLEAFIRLKRQRVPLRRDVIYLAVADEERGGLQGTGWILDRHPELFTGAAAVLGEGGANKQAAGRPLWAGIEVAQKRPLWLRATTTGRGGHGSGLNPASANHALIEGLARVIALPMEYHVTDAVRLYLGTLGPMHQDRYTEIFTHLDEHITPQGPKEPMMVGMANLFLDTIQVTVLSAGEKINVIPPDARAELDVRMLPDTDGDALLQRIEDAAGKRVHFEVLLTSPPAPPSPVDSPIYQAIASVLQKTAPVVPAFIPGFTDSRFFRERGIPAYGVSPFFLPPQSYLGIHGPDEAIPLKELDRGVERMVSIVHACATR